MMRIWIAVLPVLLLLAGCGGEKDAGYVARKLDIVLPQPAAVTSDVYKRQGDAGGGVPAREARQGRGLCAHQDEERHHRRRDRDLLQPHRQV